MDTIVVNGLSKKYPRTSRDPGLAASFKALFRRNRDFVTALQDASFTIAEGEIVGFLGPNGAGKTTTLKMLAGIMVPTSGEATVLGYTPFDRDHRFLAQIALVMGNRQQLWWDLPAQESFAVLGDLYDVPPDDLKTRIHRLVEGLELEDKVNVPVRRLSLGERMKCELVAALLHRPKVLFLDEPTIGLDIVSQERIRHFVAELNREDGCTVLLTSHYMRDVQELCERVIVVGDGRIGFDGRLKDVASKLGASKRVRVAFEHTAEVPALDEFGTVVGQDGHTVELDISADSAPQVASALLNRYAVQDISIEDPPIEEVVKRLFAAGSGTPEPAR
ncbi:MAG: ATP-binding cassette domain-containing protein [Fimbriimonadaceae bacterium]